MTPHLVRAQSAYKDIRIDSFHQTFSLSLSLSVCLTLSLRDRFAKKSTRYLNLYPCVIKYSLSLSLSVKKRRLVLKSLSLCNKVLSSLSLSEKAPTCALIFVLV